MRLAIFSDVHANLPALEAVLADARACAVDGYLVAGDLLIGPHPGETTQCLRSLDAVMIRGNSDINLLRYVSGQGPAAWYTAHQWALTRWSAACTRVETLAVVAALPEQRMVPYPGTAPIRLVHGSPRNPFEGLDPYLEPEILDVALAMATEPVLVCGHTHVAWQIERDGRLALNPGAVCGPLNGDVRAQYAVLEWSGDRWHVEHRAVPYDLALIRRAFEETRLLAEGGALARAYLLSIETGRNIGDDFLQYAYHLAEQNGHAGCDVVPDEIWDRAEATFDWG